MQRIVLYDGTKTVGKLITVYSANNVEVWSIMVMLFQNNSGVHFCSVYPMF
jgi:hypothetical protein